MSNIKDMHYTICLNVISSSGRFALPPLFGELEQRGALQVRFCSVLFFDGDGNGDGDGDGEEVKSKQKTKQF